MKPNLEGLQPVSESSQEVSSQGSPQVSPQVSPQEVSPQVSPQEVSSQVSPKKVLTAEYKLEDRCAEFLQRYPDLRGQYNLELVNCTPYLVSDEKEALLADYQAVFKGLGWQEFAYTSRLDSLVPDSRTPFKDRVTFCWYTYSPYSKQGSRMRALYRNVLFRDSATWYMTNKQAMLRRLHLFENARLAAINAGLATRAAATTADVSSACFVPATLVYSRGREAVVAAGLAPGRTYIVKPANGLKGRGIELYRCVRAAGPEFSEFMLARYGESSTHCGFYVVQLYIERPLLIQGRKFDMRVYMLVVPNMSCCQGCDSNAGRRGIFAFYHPGFARLSALEYGNGVSRDRRVHLTNSCVQEQPAPLETARPPRGCSPGRKLNEACNWTPDQVNEYFNERHDLGKDRIPRRDWFRVTAQADMQGIMAYVISQFSRTLATADPYNSFKLLGCDFLLDETGRSWLLEINSLPSLRVRTTCHGLVKIPMQREALALAIEVAHRSANGLPVTSRCLAMRQNFSLVYSATNPRVQGSLIRAYAKRLKCS